MKLRKLVTMREALEDPGYFAALLAGDSWAAWRVLLIAICGEELTDDEREVFKALTGREREPLEMVEEFWAIIGRRGGKTRAAGILAGYLGACIDHRDVIAPGERGVLPILAASTAQAAQAFNFVEGIFKSSPHLSALVENVTSDTISLSTGIDITIRPASFRTIRGVSAIGGLGDEIAYWRTDGDVAANPDVEILRALRPALATTGGPLICISSPHAKRGALYDTYKRHYGPAGHPLILVAKAPSRTMNPSLPQSVVDRAYEADPEAASAEYGAEFRNDIGAFVSRDAIEAAVARGVTVRAPLAGVSYIGAVDPSGGSSDSMTAAVAHAEGQRIILDCILERKPPFSPDSVVAEFATVFKSYRVNTIHGDRYAGEWPRERFSMNGGIIYNPAEMNRSEIYLSFLPLLNSDRVDLLDNNRMVAQFAGLERRTSRGGRDTVDHGQSAHDDLCNSAALAIVLASIVAPGDGWIKYYEQLLGLDASNQKGPLIKLRAPVGCSHVHLLSGKGLCVPNDRIIAVTEEDAKPLFSAGFERLTPEARRW